MSFEDLPPEWSTRPLGDEPLTSDVVDLFARESDRMAGCLLLLLCDAEHRLLQPIAIDHVPRRPDAAAKRRAFAFLEGLSDDSLTLVATICRPVGKPWDGEARSWRQALEDAAARAGVGLLGTYLATPGAVHSISPTRAA